VPVPWPRPCAPGRGELGTQAGGLLGADAGRRQLGPEAGRLLSAGAGALLGAGAGLGGVAGLLLGRVEPGARGLQLGADVGELAHDPGVLVGQVLVLAPDLLEVLD